MLNSDMISVSVLAAQSGLSDRRIRTLCQQGRILGASLIGGVWMLPPNATLPERVNGRPRKVSPRVAPKAQPVPLSQTLQLSFPYDWSNPEISTEALIINVLKRGIFEDVSRVCLHFGMDAIERARSHLPVDEANNRSLSRMLRNIVIGMEPFSDDQGSFAMAALAIHQRVRYRDLLDLKTFLMRGRQLEQIFQLAVEADPACSVDYAKSVLIGDVPLDKADEGFASIGVSESIEEIYAFFQARVDAYEQSVAMKMAGGG